MYNIGPKYNYLRERGTEFPSANNFLGYKVSTRNVKISPSQNAAYIKLNKTVKKESPGEREKHLFNSRAGSMGSRAMQNALPYYIATRLTVLHCSTLGWATAEQDPWAAELCRTLHRITLQHA